ncbi:MAG: DinB family protein [Chitinophagaceae bacterium]|nr:DinB family protein [Chitinophagaceae bacterium]
MLTKTLSALFTRDLNKLKTEIAAYKNEAIMWEVSEGIANSAGNLCLHLVGNLNAFIGAELGKSGFIRQRDLEFSLKNVPREEILEKIDATIDVVNKVLEMVTDEQLNSAYPLLVFKEPMTSEYFLVHLSSHLTYHLGQINYHRRLLDH